jgi:hypothetical protein
MLGVVSKREEVGASWCTWTSVGQGVQEQGPRERQGADVEKGGKGLLLIQGYGFVYTIRRTFNINSARLAI